MQTSEKQIGFSIIELMVTILIASLLLTVGVPSFASLIANNRITSQANELVSGLNLARSEAFTRGQRVTICSSTDGDSCAADTDWATGWIVFNDADGDGVVANVSDILREWEAVTGDTTLTGSVNFVTYQGNGSVNAAANFNMTIPNGSTSQTRRICIALAGNNWVNRPSSNC
ncbi:MAG: GspH/FimT family pseudopilin [Gammaproteobacteria bacterium]|nr:GspH/FimT family pseudopilin [Gammaproteobacteria bacterium]